jgi:hypothetical protein
MGKVGGQNEILDFCWSPFVRMAPSASVAMPCLPVSSVATSLLGSGQSGELVIIRGGLGRTYLRLSMLARGGTGVPLTQLAGAGLI